MAMGLNLSDSKIQFKDLALKELDAVFRMAFHLSRNADDAHDLVQETYLKAFKAEHTFELRERGIKPWLFKILHNNFYTKLDKQKRRPVLVEDLSYEADKRGGGDGGDVWDLSTLDWDHVDERLKGAIDDLPEHYQQVLLLWAVEGLKYREVADVLGIALGTVMSRLYRARTILAGNLAELAEEHGIKT